MGPGFSEVQGPPRGEWWCPVKDTECTEMAGGPHTCSSARGVPQQHAWGGMRGISESGALSV